MPILPRSKSANNSRLGFTLLELIVAIALIGLLVGLAVPRLDRYLEIDMKKASNRLASTIRYLYNKSATERLYLRLVFDIGEQTYWVEATRDPVMIASPEEQERVAKLKEIEKRKSESPAAGAAEKKTEEGGTELPPPLMPSEPTFSKIEEYLLKPTRLPEDVFIKDIYVEHIPTAVAGGQVAIHFFPNGYVEEAIVNLRDEDDEVHYSLKTNPVTGEVSVESEYRRMEE